MGQGINGCSFEVRVFARNLRTGELSGLRSAVSEGLTEIVALVREVAVATNFLCNEGALNIKRYEGKQRISIAESGLGVGQRLTPETQPGVNRLRKCVELVQQGRQLFMTDKFSFKIFIVLGAGNDGVFSSGVFDLLGGKTLASIA